MEVLANVVGIIGTALILTAYFLLQAEKITSEQLIYSLLNFFGAGGVVFSLMFDWNLPSFIVESSWVLISMFGVAKYLRGSEADTSS